MVIGIWNLWSMFKSFPRYRTMLTGCTESIGSWLLFCTELDKFWLTNRNEWLQPCRFVQLDLVHSLFCLPPDAEGICWTSQPVFWYINHNTNSMMCWNAFSIVSFLLWSLFLTSPVVARWWVGASNFGSLAPFIMSFKRITGVCIWLLSYCSCFTTIEACWKLSNNPSSRRWIQGIKFRLQF